jgi:RNA polymerase sigma-70 factor (ECF subfamily)
MCGDDRLAEDLLQETYYRFLRSSTAFESDDHRRNYLFRIATNLVHDHRRRPRVEVAAAAETVETVASGPAARAADRAVARIDLSRAMGHLKPRDRSLLWLAYAQGWSHEEIAASLGVKRASLKAMLHRARQRLAQVMRSAGGRS